MPVISQPPVITCMWSSVLCLYLITNVCPLSFITNSSFLHARNGKPTLPINAWSSPTWDIIIFQKHQRQYTILHPDMTKKLLVLSEKFILKIIISKQHQQAFPNPCNVSPTFSRNNSNQFLRFFFIAAPWESSATSNIQFLLELKV